MAKGRGRKPAIEISGRAVSSGSRKPKSALDDFGKWVVEQGAKKIAKKDIKTIKRYARGIGWSGDVERKGLETVLEKKVGSGVKRGGRKTKLAKHKLDMQYKKQDKYARTYGDYKGPHDRFFSSMDSGRARRSEFNKRANAAWNAEVEIGRKQSARTSRQTKRYLTHRPTKSRKGK